MRATESATSRYLLRAAGAIAVAGLVFILASVIWSWQTSRTYTITYRLHPQDGAALAPADIEAAARRVAERLTLLASDFHVSHVSARAVPPDLMEVQLKARSAPDEALSWATMPCRVEFRLLQLGAQAPGAQTPGAPVPPDCEVKVYRAEQYILSQPGDLQTVRQSYVVERRPALVLDGVREASIDTTGLHKMAVLTFRLGDKDAAAFGAMTALNVGRGAFINDATAPMLFIADLSRVWVTAQVPEHLVGAVARGQAADIALDAYPDQILHGTVRSISPLLEPDTRRVKVRLEFANAEGRLKPNMFATATFAAKEAARVVVPASALLMNNDSVSVFVETAPWTFLRRAVEIGSEEGEQVRIVRGLKDGERVIVRGGILLND